MSTVDDSDMLEYLVGTEVISRAALGQAVDLADDSGRTVYEALIYADLVDERTLVKAAGKWLEVAPVWLGERTPDASATDEIPGALASEHRVLPLKFDTSADQRQLVLAMVDPNDVPARQAIATHVDCGVRPVLIGPKDLGQAIERVYGVTDDAGRSPIELIERAAAEHPTSAGNEDGDDAGANSTSDTDWEAFFDAVHDIGSVEDSAVISREMKDRPASPIMDTDAGADTDGPDGLDSLDEPLSQSQITGGIETDLDHWDLDQALDGGDIDDQDYAKIGHLFVYSPESISSVSEVDDVDAGPPEIPPSASASGAESSPLAGASTADKPASSGPAPAGDVDDAAPPDDYTVVGRPNQVGLAQLAAGSEASGTHENLSGTSEPDDGRTTTENPAIIDAKRREIAADNDPHDVFVAQLCDLAGIDQPGRDKLNRASTDDLLYATILAAVDADLLQADDLLGHLPFGTLDS